ncbi:MAG: ubiquinol oxidase subunit II [Sphingomonas oligoaromativorans]
MGGVLDPQGPVGAAERLILINATVVMLAVIIPVIVLTLGFAWWFRAGNTKARYMPDWEYSGPVELVVWSIPALVVVFLGGMAWISSHDLDPPQPLASATAKPLEIQVVALDWKWLFIYPEQGLASVNRLTVPAGTPLHFSITSSGVMNSFFIPQLGSQVYSMAGMQTQLNLIADRAGSYKGISANFSGDGFADMRFQAKAMDAAGFQKWIDSAKASPARLDAAGYAALEKPSERDPVRLYGTVAPKLFDAVVMQDMHGNAQKAGEAGAQMTSMQMPSAAQQD